MKTILQRVEEQTCYRHRSEETFLTAFTSCYTSQTLLPSDPSAEPKRTGLSLGERGVVTGSVCKHMRVSRKVSWDKVMDSASAQAPRWAALVLSYCSDGWEEVKSKAPQVRRVLLKINGSTSTHRGKGRPVRVLQGFTVDEGKKSCTPDSNTYRCLKRV